MRGQVPAAREGTFRWYERSGSGLREVTPLRLLDLRLGRRG
ncbi:hypothetical protein [Streptomyces sp. NPDC060002]